MKRSHATTSSLTRCPAGRAADAGICAGEVGSLASSSSARRAMSKKLVQLWGLVMSPCGVPRSRWKVLGPSMEGVVLKPSYWCCHHDWRAHGDRMAVAPPTSIPASHPAICGGTPRRVHPSSIASRDTESKARRMSQLEVYNGVLVSSAYSRALMNWMRAVSVPRPGRKPCCAVARTRCRSHARVMRPTMMPVQRFLMTSRSRRGRRPSSVTSCSGFFGLGHSQLHWSRPGVCCWLCDAVNLGTSPKVL